MAADIFRFELRSAVEAGPGARARLPALVTGLGGRRVLLVSDSGVTRAGVAGQVEQALHAGGSGVEIAAVFGDALQDARSGAVQELARTYRASRADAMVAVGGGSVLDAAKAARWLVGRGLHEVAQELRGNRGERWPKAGPLGIPLVALPTTAGTGAEVSPVAVVLNEELGVKANLLSPFIAADVAVLDAELTLSLPSDITAFTGFDALTHAIEALFSPKANAITDAYALQAMRIIDRELPRVVAQGGDAQARQRMLEASLMAIVAFSQALDAIPVHNLAHAIGGRLGLPHGLCNAVLLPEVLSALPQHYLERAGLAAAQLGLGPAELPAAALDALIAHLRELRSQVGLPADFRALGVAPPPTAELQELVRLDPAGVAFELPGKVVAEVAAAVFRGC